MHEPFSALEGTVGGTTGTGTDLKLLWGSAKGAPVDAVSICNTYIILDYKRERESDDAPRGGGLQERDRESLTQRYTTESNKTV